MNDTIKKEPIELSEGTTIKTKVVVILMLSLITCCGFFYGFKYTMEAEARKFAYETQAAQKDFKSQLDTQANQVVELRKDLDKEIEERIYLRDKLDRLEAKK